jgi:hypothetical protein
MTEHLKSLKFREDVSTSILAVEVDSSDSTSQRAIQSSVRVVSHRFNCVAEIALRTGFRWDGYTDSHILAENPGAVSK